MNRIPSLDLMNGKVVRLLKGDFEQVTVYSEDPCACVQSLIDAGATCIHIVDLDRTRKFTDEGETIKTETLETDKLTNATYKSTNAQVIEKVIAQFREKATLQLGGGIRSYETAKDWLQMGVNRIVVSTLFFTDYESYVKLVNDFPKRVVLALDVKRDEVCHTGWQVGSGLSIDAILASGKVGDVHSVLVTDISTDGMLSGPNLTLLERLKAFPLIASGGISSESDYASIQALGIPYAIIGKAYYEGRITRLGDVLATDEHKIRRIL